MPVGMLRWERVRWLVNRLGAMSAPEIVHRVKERRLRTTGRRMGGWSSYACGAVDIVPFTILDADKDHKEQCRRDWTAIHALSRAGEWNYLGQEWPGLTGRAAWHLDPVSGREWPADAYCFDIDFRHETERGDIKYVWELNRLQFLPPIAGLARLNGDADAARYCLDTIEDWAQANPPFQGVNWASGIELALRAISILLSISLLGPETLSSAQRQRIGAILNAHAVWLLRYPSRYSSANNHLVAEAAGLYVLGVLVPSLPQAERYRSHGRQVLVEEVEKQILSDGVGAEQSPTYMAFTVELYCIALAAARASGDVFPPAVESRLSKALTFLRWITDGAGSQPRYGDDDEGRVVVSLSGTEPHCVSSVMSGLCAVTGEPGLAPPVAVPHLRDLLLGRAVAAPMAALRGLHSFDVGGYSVFRRPVAGHDAMLVFDHGPLGYLSIAAHGHADALSVWLHVDGRPVLIDAGTYLYHSGGAARDHFRGTGAHNTLQVDSTNQSTISGAFNWSHKARAWRVQDPDGADANSVVARHDGYRKRFGVVHERQVTQLDDGYVLTDRLDGAPGKVTETRLRFYLSAEISAARDAAGVVTVSLDGSRLLRLRFHTSEGVALVPDVEMSEISPRFGVKQASAVIVLAPPLSAWSHGGAVITRMQLN